MIQVIDYKAGNLTSVVKALKYLGAETHVTQSPDDVRKADMIVLPGVGHFRATQLLHDLQLTEATREAIARGVPFLGICVGLQWLYQGSTEAESTDGLCAFNGQCERFPRDLQRSGIEEPARRLELARRHPFRLKAAARHRAGRLRLLHALLARIGRCRHRRHHALRRRLHRSRRTRQRDGRAVSPGEVRGYWFAVTP